jgi:orotidine-5'-phosphate decarboxylase
MDQVVRLALRTQAAELDGVVCSAHEIEALRRECGKDFILMVPGIRPEGTASDDQKRVMTPREAIHRGASHLVIGRPITGATDPAQAARSIIDSLS